MQRKDNATCVKQHVALTKVLKRSKLDALLVQRNFDVSSFLHSGLLFLRLLLIIIYVIGFVDATTKALLLKAGPAVSKEVERLSSTCAYDYFNA